MERIHAIQAKDPNSRILVFYFPADLAEKRVELYVNGVRVRATYGGRGRESRAGHTWTCQVLITSDVESGIVSVDGIPFRFSAKRSDFPRTYFVEVYRDPETGKYILYQGKEARNYYI